jgi:O-acetyl-ADP-ribose deacetylase (regulator of RNase III)
LEAKRKKSGRRSTKFKLVHLADSNKRFVIKAVGIPTISDDIAGIKTKEIAKQLGLG